MARGCLCRSDALTKVYYVLNSVPGADITNEDRYAECMVSQWQDSCLLPLYACMCNLPCTVLMRARVPCVCSNRSVFVLNLIHILSLFTFAILVGILTVSDTHTHTHTHKMQGDMHTDKHSTSTTSLSRQSEEYVCVCLCLSICPQDEVARGVEAVRTGNHAVPEKRHTVVIGWDPAKTPLLLKQVP